MNQSLCQHVEGLRSAILSLPPTGEKGFEGLIGVALREISGVPFRLAGSGRQFGVDGKPAYEGDSICFEAKRYEKSVPRVEVISKIAELSLRGSGVDIWVLGATSRISSQPADDARSLGAKNGIVVLILDWSEMDLPPLAVALATGGTRVQDFLKMEISDDESYRKALAALEAVRSSQGYAAHADRIRAECNGPAVGWPIAQKANADWLCDAFSSRNRAKVKLGQPLSPGDTDRGRVKQRKTLIDKLRPYLALPPDKKAIFILGGEGNGKSWIVAQTWLASTHRALMIFMSPDEFAETSGQINVTNLLVTKLIEQTGDEANETTRQRWCRRLNQWRSCSATETPRLVAFIDGINQRPKNDWGRIIDRIGDELNQLGGRLIVTTRTPYFQGRVKGRLSVPFTEITVPEWAEAERDEILTGHGIRASDLHRSVAKSLRNPRLLGIAIELLEKANITNLEEISVSRLLFEHIRMSERDAPVPQPSLEFVRRLQKDAQEIMSRVKAKQQDDLTVLEADLAAVAEGRFYHAVDGDPTRYSLEGEGLTLALGFAAIDRLRTAKRNKRDLGAVLTAILEPIGALDDTADVIMAALTVTLVDEQHDQNIASSLVEGFATLQNPDQAKFPAFVGLARHGPQGFMDAAHALCLARGHQPNFDWIEGALIEASTSGCAWGTMADAVHTWLSAYSLSPERGTFLRPKRDPQEKVEEEREKKRKNIEEKLQALSTNERAILKTLSKRENADLSRLSRLALLLLAGKSLAPFATSLLNWTFSHALNCDLNAPYKEFMHLVRLNRVDWLQTRAALLEVSAALREADVSTTGRWALANILRATGHSDDGKEAESLVESLTKDMPHFKGWRLIENYCEADPCDPASVRPANLAQTAQRYAAIDVTKLRRSNRSQTSEDHFFAMARPAVARFEPKIAIEKHRELVLDVLRRKGFPLRQGLFELHQHNALLAIEEAQEFVNKRNESKAPATADGLPEQDAWIVSQYHLLLAFPFLSAREQAETLLSDKMDEPILLDLMELVKPLDETQFENLLATACNEDNEHKQYLLLLLARCTSVHLSTDACTRVAGLFRSRSDRVRREALGVIAQSDDEGLLREVVESGWKAAGTATEKELEAWYGSIALLEATARGLIAHEKTLDRISACLYGRAAAMLHADAVRDIARRIDASINQAAGLQGNLVAPDIEIQVDQSVHCERSMVAVSERSSEADDIKEWMKRLSESDEAIEQRQQRTHEAFRRFKARLTLAKARIVLDNLSLEEFAAVVAADQELASRWHGLFMSIDRAKLPTVHNLVLLLAHALRRTDPEKAQELFLRVRDSSPLVRFTFGEAGVQLVVMATWAGIRSPVLDDLRFGRLDRAGTDYDLSIEVLAALMNGKQELLTTYIEAKLGKGEPAEISRGIMVAGFSDQSQFNDEVLRRYDGSAGLIGDARKAAKYAYDRNVWARYWFGKMCQTNENADFWRYSVLLSKIVDGRFAVWRSNYAQKGNSIRSFGPSVEDKLKTRFSRWKDHRSKRLFGSDAPAPIFLR